MNIKRTIQVSENIKIEQNENIELRLYKQQTNNKIEYIFLFLFLNKRILSKRSNNINTIITVFKEFLDASSEEKVIHSKELLEIVFNTLLTTLNKQ